VEFALRALKRLRVAVLHVRCNMHTSSRPERGYGVLYRSAQQRAHLRPEGGNGVLYRMSCTHRVPFCFKRG
jgi:hypothetical protein